ncbi:Uncharacterised protein [Yersinia enterocolitica]|uniref:Uncharacterized protein n=1 Tax=Yersinia enterocolitica TaxID=630 RepID=B0RKW2_YEREN|nr:hypothetical protein [Yersinia enterocolitica]CRF12303.1 Uncharacterised protein [Yersinia enterocolitica]
MTKTLKNILLLLCILFIATFLLLMISVPFLLAWEPDTIHKDIMVTAISYGTLAYGGYSYITNR